ncbi:hypothetical protein FGI60_21855 [Brucella haematophila]|nr:hypothetical protein FGI60_21855 [Brucella haematophila]
MEISPQTGSLLSGNQQDAVRKAGGPAALEAIRRGLKGYANGGAVGVPSVASISAPRIPSLSGMSQTNNNTTNNAPSIHVSVTGANGNAEIAAMVQEGVARGIEAWQGTSQFTLAVGRGAQMAQRKGMVRRP